MNIQKKMKRPEIFNYFLLKFIKNKMIIKKEK